MVASFYGDAKWISRICLARLWHRHVVPVYLGFAAIRASYANIVRIPGKNERPFGLSHVGQVSVPGEVIKESQREWGE